MPTEQQSWWQRWQPPIRPTLVVIGVVLLVLFGWFWWLGVPALYRNAGGGPGVENARLNAITTIRAALLAVFVGLSALGTLWLNNRVYRITARTFEVTERGQLTDRYSRAIEQLGSETLDVRLGGIYALEQIATDSPRSRDQATIVEVLSAFVRVHSDPVYQYKVAHPESAAAQPEPAEEQRRKAIQYVAKLEKPPIDVHAAVTVLSRLPVRPEVERADLSGAWLMRLNLSDKRANLTGARLGRSNLFGADLAGADLSGAYLAGADLTDADLAGADLSGAYLAGAHLTDADLTEANLSGADLTVAHLTDADLTGADLTGAHLVVAYLTGAHLVGADLTGAHLFGADLAGADLSGAHLQQAIFLTQQQLENAWGDSKTPLPAELRLPPSWL